MTISPREQSAALQNRHPRLSCRVISLIRTLRTFSLCEGVSFLVLMLAAMPLKYIWGIDTAVRYTGWIHGILFMIVYALLLAALVRGALPFKTAALTGIAALVPAGPFFMDRTLRRHETQNPG